MQLYEGRFKLSKTAHKAGQWLRPASNLAPTLHLHLELFERLWGCGSLEFIMPVQKRTVCWKEKLLCGHWELWNNKNLLPSCRCPTPLCRRLLWLSWSQGLCPSIPGPQAFPLTFRYLEFYLLPEAFLFKLASCDFSLTPPFINIQLIELSHFFNLRTKCTSLEWINVPVLFVPLCQCMLLPSILENKLWGKDLA